MNPAGDPRFAERVDFEQAVHDWRLAEIGPGPKASCDEERAWEAKEEQRFALARAVVARPAPVLGCLRGKLDVLIRYASSIGDDASDDERIVLEGLCALRADVVLLGG